MIRIPLGALLTLLVLYSTVSAQHGPGTGRPPEESGLLEIETLTLPTPDSSRCRVDVLFRIQRRFFVFVRPEQVYQEAPFAARAEIALELFDKEGHSVARDFSTRQLGASSPQAGGEGSEVGLSSFSLPPGTYSLFVEIRDRESDRVVRSTTPLAVPPARDSALASGILLCAPAPAGSGSDIVPLNHGGDIPLGSRADAWFLVASPDSPARCTAEVRILRSPSETLDSAAVGADTLASLPVTGARILVGERVDSTVRYSRAGEPLPGLYELRLPLSIDTLVAARYTLEVTVRAGSKVWRGTAPFAIRWYDMPLSLRYVESAIEPMEYLLTPDEFGALRRSDARGKRAFFDSYWKARDLTPGTAYNEALAEFYRRVDYARRTFGTLKVENGAKTERGKAYILFGPPERIERTLLATSAPQEVWYYPALGRKMTFVDRGRTGDYTLVATEQL